MSDLIKPSVAPALTVGGWAAVGELNFPSWLQLALSTEQSRLWPEIPMHRWEAENRFMDISRHAIAAIALVGQDFGFTWRDVRQLRGDLHPDGRLSVLRLADRIEALLRPSDTGDKT